jgi:hypothetical protein
VDIYIVMCDYGEPEVDSVWLTRAEALERSKHTKGAITTYIEQRIIGEIGVAYF